MRAVALDILRLWARRRSSGLGAVMLDRTIGAITTMHCGELRELIKVLPV